MSRRVSGRVFPVVAALAVSACGESGTQSPAAPEPPRPTNVAVRPAEARLTALDATVQLTSEVHDQNGRVMSGADVSWTSSDAVVAHVNASGLVTAAGNGSATITADAGGATGTATVTVEQEATALTLGPEALTFRALGDTLRLVAEATDANGHPIAVAWTSSEEAVAHVDAAGLVTAVGNGSARITATAGAAIKSAVVVVEQVAADLELAPKAIQFRALDDTLRLVAEATDANGHAIESVTWISSNAAVAAVDASGLVTARGNGSARITATASGAISSATVTVEQEAAALGLPTADTLLWYGEPGDTLRLAMTATDANGHPLERVLIESIPIKWSTSRSGVATVDDGGLVKGTGEGFTTITATAANRVKASTELRVVNRDRAALAAFYHGTGGPDWWCNENWITDMPMDTWCGVSTSIRADGVVMVTWLNLAGNRLTGPIPAELGSLVNLYGLNLSSNHLTGPIPAELGRLVNLYRLNLSNNDLTGPIPPELGNLARLGALYLFGNQLTGSVPPVLGSLVDLYHLYLLGNQLTGSIPPELGNLARLQRLSLGDNNLTGSIPPELGSLASLLFLNLTDNQLTGPIPPELGRLASLEGLNLYNNQLTGPIPPELGNLASLQWLYLENNQLTGPIPPELGTLTLLARLHVHGNATLSGRLPETLTGLQLRDFHWHDTQLCHPPTPSFQRWLQSIEEHQGGPPCES